MRPAQNRVPGDYDEWLDPELIDWAILEVEDDDGKLAGYTFGNAWGYLDDATYPSLEAAHAAMKQAHAKDPEMGPTWERRP